jgi:hypothetical protein
MGRNFPLTSSFLSSRLLLDQVDEAPRPRAGLPEQNVSKGYFVRIVPLHPAYKAGPAGHGPVKMPLPPSRNAGLCAARRNPS